MLEVRKQIKLTNKKKEKKHYLHMSPTNKPSKYNLYESLIPFKQFQKQKIVHRY